MEGAAADISPRPSVRGLFGSPLAVRSSDMVLVDVAEPRATMRYLRRRFGPDAAMVALIDPAWIDRLGSALAEDWADYLFFPVNEGELGLVWDRHRSKGEAPHIELDVDERGHLRAVFPARVSHQGAAVERLVVACRHLSDLDRDTAFRLRVGLGEAVTNAILHGSSGLVGAVVRVHVAPRPGLLRVRVRDQGEGFDPESVPDPTSSEGIGRARGRGLFLLRRMADEVAFNESGNQVALTFRAAPDPWIRIEPLLARFAEVTGLAFRLEREAGEESRALFDAWEGDAPPEPPATRESRPLGEDGGLRLVSEAGGQEAATLLEGWLAAVAEGGAVDERLLGRSMRRERLLAELETARDLLLRLMPDPAAFGDMAEVSARCDPALSLGGDFYYLARLPGGRLGVMLGDVSSHGPSAGLVLARTLSAVAIATGAETEPAATLEALRGHLRPTLASTEMYMTLFYGVLDSARGELAYANAGHPYAYRLEAGGARRLKALDPPLGLAPGERYRYAEERVPWRGGTLLAFTDGLAELSDPVETAGHGVRARIERGLLDPEGLIAALFAASDEEMRLDDRTAVAARL